MIAPAPVNRLQSVTIEPGMVAVVTYTNGKTVHVSLEAIAGRLEAFAPLADPSEFAQARVEDFGWTLSWPCGASLDSDRVLEISMEQAG